MVRNRFVNILQAIPEKKKKFDHTKTSCDEAMTERLFHDCSYTFLTHSPLNESSQGEQNQDSISNVAIIKGLNFPVLQITYTKKYPDEKNTFMVEKRGN